MEVGDGVLGTISIFSSSHKGSGAGRVGALQPGGGKRPCPAFDIARPRTSCERNESCPLLHVEKVRGGGGVRRGGGRGGAAA